MKNNGFLVSGHGPSEGTNNMAQHINENDLFKFIHTAAVTVVKITCKLSK